MLRILLNAATVLSLVMCVVTVAAWGRSYRASDDVWWTLVNPRRELFIDTYRGGLLAGVIKPTGTRDSLHPPGPDGRHGQSRSYAEMGGQVKVDFAEAGTIDFECQAVVNEPIVP